MGKTIFMAGAIINIAESQVECPHCEREVPFEEIEDKWVKQDNPYLTMKCKCKRPLLITTDHKGDFIELTPR
jgi:hypothetical protein